MQRGDAKLAKRGESPPPRACAEGASRRPASGWRRSPLADACAVRGSLSGRLPPMPLPFLAVAARVAPKFSSESTLEEGAAPRRADARARPAAGAGAAALPDHQGGA
ncbi:unnamed protein product [Prorocentrum cordatum]|uniref:Uncharacterized protein n=1 Tax=Prorocentrum cordatum TaxID=2364126 RepID=A0ABN9UAH2_9DINO|nr:unnamed protein product [Polarella glacialis]